MTRKESLLHIFFLILLSGNLHAITWQTASFGYWDNPSTWKGNAVPPYSSKDTFIIDQPIIIDQNLEFAGDAYVLINAGGGLCGHHSIFVNTGATIIKYGILELDSLFIPGGIVDCRAPGEVILTRQGQLTNNGFMDVNGCSLAVGPWFYCRLPEYSFAVPVGVNTYSVNKTYRLFPNPGSAQLVLSGKIEGPAFLEFKDLAGRLVYYHEMRADKLEQHQISMALPAGMYFWQLRTNTAILEKGSICIAPL